jgi:hypothetical protein
MSFVVNATSNEADKSKCFTSHCLPISPTKEEVVAPVAPDVVILVVGEYKFLSKLQFPFKVRGAEFSHGLDNPLTMMIDLVILGIILGDDIDKLQFIY